MSAPLFGNAQRRCLAAAAIEKRVVALAHRQGLDIARVHWNDSVTSSRTGLYRLTIDTARDTAKLYFTERELTTYDDTLTRQEVDGRLESVLVELQRQPQESLVASLLDAVKGLR